MEISVIVPVYNAEATLQRTLDALSKQDFFSFEVILVDNGSIDNSALICKKMAQKDARFVYMYIEKKGVSNARNIGIANSRARYVCFCDADDIPSSNMLSVLYENIDKTNSGMVMCNYFSERDNRNSKFPDYWPRVLDEHDIKEKLIPAMFYSEAGLDAIWGTVWRAIFKRNIIIDNGLKFDEKLTFAEDLCFVMEYLYCIDSVILESRVLYNYSMVEGSAMLSYNRYKRDLFSERKYLISKINTIVKRIFRNEVPNSFMRNLNTIYQEYILECIGNSCVLDEKNKMQHVCGRVKEIIHSAIVQDVFSEVQVEDKKKQIIFGLIKHKCTHIITLYYLLRKNK